MYSSRNALVNDLVSDIVTAAELKSSSELQFLAPARVEEMNIRHKLAYAADLRSLDNPSSVLDSTLALWRQYGFLEAVNKVEQALSELKSMSGRGQRSLSDYMGSR